MQAIRVHPSSSTPYSPSNPAPPSALHLDGNVPIPNPCKEGELEIRIRASTVIRDMLTWPETYYHEYAIPGNDFSGTVIQVFSDNSAFKPGDEVFGMAHAERGSTWAEYAIIKESEVALKPRHMTWEEAAALPLSAQTAYEALFEHGSITVPTTDEITQHKTTTTNSKKKKGLISGASGGVGIYLVQLAAVAGLHVVAATSSNTRNQGFLLDLGANETIEYTALEGETESFDIIIDTVGGDLLAQCWQYVKSDGALISVDSASFNFVQEHEKRGLRKVGVKSLFFIVEGNGKELEILALFAEIGILRSFVVDTYPIGRTREAYQHASGRYSGRGKIVLMV